jgi:hypothetical protein
LLTCAAGTLIATAAAAFFPHPWTVNVVCMAAVMLSGMLAGLVERS